MRTIAYWLSCAISGPMIRFDWAWLYPTYNRLMAYSGAGVDEWVSTAEPPFK